MSNRPEKKLPEMYVATAPDGREIEVGADLTAQKMDCGHAVYVADVYGTANHSGIQIVVDAENVEESLSDLEVLVPDLLKMLRMSLGTGTKEIEDFANNEAGEKK